MAKINTDITVFGEDNAIGVRVIIKDERGNVIMARARKIGGKTNVLRAEILVTREGLLVAKDLGLKAIILEGDSKSVFDDFESSY